MRPGVFVLLSISAAAYAQTSPPAGLLDAVIGQAETFQRDARNLLSTATLAQRCYRIPEHSRIAIGRAADTLYAQMVRHEIESEYRIGASPSGNLIEMRSVWEKDGKTVRTSAAARKALALDASAGEEQIQKKFLQVFTDLGLLDVATNYGLMLLVFTHAGIVDLQVDPVGPRYFGAEDAYVFHWRQLKGGLLQLRGRKPIRHPMQGELWVRLSDGMPLRITSGAEYAQPKHRIREDATVEFVPSSAGCAMPLLALHRHFVDDQLLTENFYTYGPFRRFHVDSDIRFSDAPPK
jgi:hypothetical protein